MRIAYIHGADIPIKHFGGGFIEMMNTMLASFAAHSDVDRVICALDPSPVELKHRIKVKWPTTFIEPLRWKEGLHYPDIRIPTMCKALNTFAKEGDEILSLEADLLFTGDPYDVFEFGFHIGIPQRSQWVACAPVNIGFFAMRWDNLTRQFMRFWDEQVREPSHELVLRYHRLGSAAGRTVEENVPNAILSGLSTGQLTVLPSEYNWYPSEMDLQTPDVSAVQFREKFNNPGRCRVLHFKGDNKQVMAELGGHRD